MDAMVASLMESLPGDIYIHVNQHISMIDIRFISLMVPRPKLLNASNPN
jgi:hypothetical protein